MLTGLSGGVADATLADWRDTPCPMIVANFPMVNEI
jgi:hypothetical protein